MGSTENHLKRIREHLEGLRDAIDAGIENKPVTIGLHCSACAIELLELYLHSIHKIPIGKVVKHNWFKKPQEGQKVVPLAKRKMRVEFPDKDKIYNLIYAIEDLRENLVYGTPSEVQIKEVYNAFQRLKSLLSQRLNTEGIDLEKS